MKKVLSLVIVAMVLVAVAACGKKNTPETVAKSFLEQLSKKDYDKAKEFATAESATNLDMLKSNPAKEELKFEVKDSKIEGDAATVNYTENGTAKVLNLVKVNDEWKVKYEKEMPPMDLTDDSTQTDSTAPVK